jgi:predicted nucleotidyltransferase
MSAADIGATIQAQSTAVIAAVALITAVGVGGAAMGIGPDAGLQTGAAQQEAPLETAVSLEPSGATVETGETTTYDVVVDTANGGVGAYDFSVSIDDPSVASISDVDVDGEPADATTEVSIAEDGSAADVKAALADTDDSGGVTVATVTVRGDDAGTSDIGLTVDARGTEAGASYAVTETTGASITVESDDPAPEPEPDPASFEVSNLDAPDSATQGENITVSAEVTNDGDEEATQTVAFRLDADGDETLEEGETLVSEEVTLDGGESQTVTFSDLDTSGLDAGSYAHGVVTDDDSATATIAIESADDGGDGDDSDDGDDGNDGDDGDDADDADDGDDGDDGDDADDGDDDETARETAVSLQLSDSTVSVGETTTYDVVVDTADGGVGAYDFSVSIDDPSVASISDVAVSGDPSGETTEVSIAEDGSAADVKAALADTDDSGSVTIATVTVRGDDAGTSDIGLAVEALGTEAGASYAVTETTGASITVASDDPEPEPEPDPASFRVSNLDAPDSATQGDAIDVSAEVTNDGDEEATKTAAFRLDVDGDGTLDGDEELASQEVTLEGGESQTVTFSDLDTSGLDADDYAHGVFTDDDSATATIAIESVDEGDDGDDSDEGDDGDDSDDGDDAEDGADEEFSLDEIAQAKYDHDFADLSTETAGEVQAIYNRQPFPEGTDPADIRTRDEIANDRYGHDFDDVSRETTIEIQNDYDAQFGPLPSDPAFTLDEIAQAKYGQDFADLSTETAGEVQAIYNRQPFPDGTEPGEIRTRDEITNERYGHDFDDVSRETTIEVQNDYDAQFELDN